MKREKTGKFNARELLALGLFQVLSVANAAAGLEKSVAEVCQTSTDAAFRAKYCTAAKDLNHGYKANRATSAVWAGVSVACTAACGKKANESLCSGASMGGSAGEGVITKKFSDSLMSEGMKWGTAAMKAKPEESASTGDAAAAPESEGIVNAEACKTAGTSALKAYEKYSNSKENAKGIRDLRDQTKDMNVPKGGDTFTYGGGDSIGTAPSANGASTSAAMAGADVCSEGAVATALGAIQCAAKSDPTLPAYAKSETFLKDLQKATGKSPDAFFADFDNPGKSILNSAPVASLPKAQQQGVADSLSAMEGYSRENAAKLASAKSDSAPQGYTSTGGNSLGATQESELDINGALSNMLGQMTGGSSEMGPKGNGAGAGVGRTPANDTSVAENRKISIFDRVGWRYGAVTARDALGVR